MAETTEQYNANRRARVERFLEGQSIARRHAENGIPLDIDAYPSNMRMDIGAGVIRLGYDTNLAAGRYLDDGGDENGEPTRPMTEEQRNRIRRIWAEEVEQRERGK